MSAPDTVAVEVDQYWPDDADEDEGIVSTWFVREGADVEEDDLLCEIQVEKVDADVLAPATGTLAEILVDEDGEFQRGDVLARIEPS